MTAGGQQYDVVAGGAAVDGIAAEGIAFKKIDEYNKFAVARRHFLRETDQRRQ